MVCALIHTKWSLFGVHPSTAQARHLSPPPSEPSPVARRRQSALHPHHVPRQPRPATRSALPRPRQAQLAETPPHSQRRQPAPVRAAALRLRSSFHELSNFKLLPELL